MKIKVKNLQINFRGYIYFTIICGKEKFKLTAMYDDIVNDNGTDDKVPDYIYDIAFKIRDIIRNKISQVVTSLENTNSFDKLEI